MPKAVLYILIVEFKHGWKRAAEYITVLRYQIKTKLFKAKIISVIRAVNSKEKPINTFEIFLVITIYNIHNTLCFINI